MLIYFSNHNFKYEIEAVAKLFFPVERFNLVFDVDVTNGTNSTNKSTNSVNDGVNSTNSTNNANDGTDNANNTNVLTDTKINGDDFIFTRVKVTARGALLWVCVRVDGVCVRKSVVVSGDVAGFDDECERNLCVLLYTLLAPLTKITPKWGVLTGVRPVSLVQKYIRLGWDRGRIYSYFQSRFLVSTEKLDLAFATANVQLDVLADVDSMSYSLYVAIPFCVSKCSYCSFVSHPIKQGDVKVDEYVAFLMGELSKTATVALELGLSLSTVYIGGGTPTALSESQLAFVVDTIYRYFPLHQVKEYTIEAGRVDTITKEKLEIIRNAWGVVEPGECTNVRISINPQTFNDDVLTKIGRNHTALDVVECYEMAKEMGFVHINMDFIAGLPSDTFESFRASMDKAVSLAPSNITVHTLSIKRSAELFKSAGKLDYDDVFSTQYMNDYAGDVLVKNGYLPYYLYRQKNTLGNLENVGYAKSVENLSLYNIYIMEENHSIIACGAGGVTKIIPPVVDLERKIKPINRIFNFKYHFEYIDRFDEILRRKEEVYLFYGKT